MDHGLWGQREREQPTERSRLLEAAVRPMERSSGLQRAFLVLLGGLVAWGGLAYLYQLRRGMGVTGLSNGVPWGTYEANIVSFIGLSYGGALTSAILRLAGASWRAPITRLAEAVALVTLLIGSAFPIIHLGRPERVWEFFVSPRWSSPLVWDVVAISTYLVATAIFFYLPLIPDLALLQDLRGRASGQGLRQRPLQRLLQRLLPVLAAGWRGLPEQQLQLERALGAVSVLIIPVAVAVHSVLAWAFALTSRPGWHSTIFAPYFVVAALYSGVALVILVVSAFRKAYRLQAYIGEVQIRNLGFLLLALGATYLYFTFAEMLTEGYVGAAESLPVLEMLLTGRYSPLFWLFVVAGLVLPILLVALPATRTVPGITVAAALAVGSMWLKRLLIVVPPLTRPAFGEAVEAYVPSWVEVSITVAATAAIPLLLMVLFRIVPVLPVWEIEHERARQHEVARSLQGEPFEAAGAAARGKGGF